jgi:hypothetical protein
MKGQSTILQYVLFFAIGISLFTTLGNILFSQYHSFNRDLKFSTAMLTNSFISSEIVYLSSQCKQCQQINRTLIFVSDQTSQTLKFQNIFADFQLRLNNSGLEIKDFMTDIFYLSPIHNLNSTINFTDSKGLLAKQLTLTYNKTKNNLEIR